MVKSNCHQQNTYYLTVYFSKKTIFVQKRTAIFNWTILCHICSSELAFRLSEEFHTFILIHRQQIQRSSNVKNFEMNQIWNRNIFRPPRISSEREVQHTWFIVVLIVAIFAFRTSYLELILELSIHALIEI